MTFASTKAMFLFTLSHSSASSLAAWQSRLAPSFQIVEQPGDGRNSISWQRHPNRCPPSASTDTQVLMRMGLPDHYARVFFTRKFLGLVIFSFTFISMGVLFSHDVSLRQKTIQKIKEILHSWTDLTTSRSARPTLDIVVSMYNENITNVAHQLSALLSLPLIQGLDVSTLIYVKDQDADLPGIKAATNATKVLPYSNYGREGGTFLSHIVLNWDYLARHTMFIQAEMHSLEEAKGKIIDYFSVNTGVLPPGYLAACNCLSCTDAWDDQRAFPRIAQLYSALNGEMCPTQITLSYLGQMLVSAKRIRQRPRKVYEHLKAVLESDMHHWIHTDPREDWAFRDDPSEPYFGHSIERAYMVLWGCDDVGIVERCGGWDGLAQRRTLEDPEWKCQCVDGHNGLGDSLGSRRIRQLPRTPGSLEHV